MPVIIVVVYASFLFSIFSSFVSGITSGAYNAALFSSGFLAAIIALGIVALIGYILFMIAMYKLSKYYSESGIFSNLLYALIIQIVGGVVAAVLVFAYIFSLVGSIQTYTYTSATPAIAQLLLPIILMILVNVAFLIVNGILYWRAFNKLAEKSGVDNFKTTGLLYLVGSILAFIGIGVIIQWIAWIFAAMGYQKMTPNPPPTAPYTSPYQATFTGPTKRCLSCGAENSPDSTYCVSCGRPLQ